MDIQDCSLTSTHVLWHENTHSYTHIIYTYILYIIPIIYTYALYITHNHIQVHTINIIYTHILYITHTIYKYTLYITHIIYT